MVVSSTANVLQATTNRAVPQHSGLPTQPQVLFLRGLLEIRDEGAGQQVYSIRTAYV